MLCIVLVVSDKHREKGAREYVNDVKDQPQQQGDPCVLTGVGLVLAHHRGGRMLG